MIHWMHGGGQLSLKMGANAQAGPTMGVHSWKVIIWGNGSWTKDFFVRKARGDETTQNEGMEVKCSAAKTTNYMPPK